MRLDRERTKLEKSSDQEEHKDKAEKSEQFDHEEVSPVQGVKLSTAMVKVQHELIVQSVETNQKEVVSKVATQHERKEATLEILLQNKTRSICDELSKRYFLQHDPYIPCFELLKEVEYGKKKRSRSLNDYEFQGSYLERIKFCNLEIYEKKQAKSKVGTRAQGIHPLIDKVKDGCGVIKFKTLSKEQWLYDGDESIELFAAPQQFPFEVGEMSDLRTNPFK
ncbi:hypothetical protein YC2023_054350 [Brassica napus]